MPQTNRNLSKTITAPVIILVEPQLPENVGMVARAMANFGLKELRLVNPREPLPNEKALATASKADYILETAQIYQDLPSALGDLHFLLATTARARDGFKRVVGPNEAAETLYLKAHSQQKTGILFGRERWGLTNEELSYSNELVTFPVEPNFPSLNLAQAVLLMSYHWRQIFLAQNGEIALNLSPAEAPKQELYHFFNQLEHALEVRGYFRPAERRAIMVHNLRSVLIRAAFSKEELRLLRGVISSLEHFSPSHKKGEGAPAGRQRSQKKPSALEEPFLVKKLSDKS